MRRALLSAILLVLAVFVAWVAMRGVGDRVEALVPSEVLGALFIQELPAHPELLGKTRLNDWLETELEAGGIPVGMDSLGEIFAVWQENVDSGCLMLHKLEARGEGRFRVHFTALLTPKWFHEGTVRDWIDAKVKATFGADRTEVSESGSRRRYRGPETGQILLVEAVGGYLVVSNSEEGRAQLEALEAGKSRSLNEHPAFGSLERAIRFRPDILLYLNGPSLSSLFPESVYAVRFEGEKLEDQFVTAD